MPNGNSAQRRKEKRAQQSFNPATEEQKPPERANEQDERRNFYEKESKKNNMWPKLRRALGSPTWWTAAFTAILTLFTYFEVQISRTTSETTRDVERAVVTFAGPSVGARYVTGQASNTSPWLGQQIFLNLVNSGDTPARAVVIRSNFQDWPAPEDLPEGYEFPLSAAKTEAVIGPKAPYSTDITLDKAKFDGVFSGKSRIFIWGDVYYKDIFNGAPHITEFCSELTHLTLGWNTPNPDKTAQATDWNDPRVSLIGFQATACKQHNCYDGDCKDYKDRLEDMDK